MHRSVAVYFSSASFLNAWDAYKCKRRRQSNKKRVAYDLIHVFISVTKLAGCRASSKSWKHALLSGGDQILSAARRPSLGPQARLPVRRNSPRALQSAAGRLGRLVGRLAEKGGGPQGDLRPVAADRYGEHQGEYHTKYYKFGVKCRVRLSSAGYFHWVFCAVRTQPVLLIEQKSKPGICFLRVGAASA